MSKIRLGVVLVVALVAQSASSSGHVAPAADGARAAPATIAIKPGTGASIGERFLGISFEKNLLAQPPLTRGNLAQFLKTLGPGVLRFGGNQVDKTFWTSSNEKPPAWALTTVTPQDLERLATLVKASGWKLLYGLNLKHKDAARAADEVAHVKRILGDAVVGIEVGNEPNYYSKEIAGYSPTQYHADYELYRKAIAKVAPGLGLVGPGGGSAPNAIEFLTEFARLQQKNPEHNLESLATHFYPHCARNPPIPTMADLLSPEFHDRIKARIQILVDAAKPLGLRTRLNEANSLTCGGVDGVSDRYGSALWLVDQAMLVASTGVTAENFHSNIAVCGGPKPPGSAYTPFCAANAADQAEGKLMVQPEYYGMLLVREIGRGSFSPVENSDPATLRAYAVTDGNRMKLVLVNLSDPASANVSARQVNVDLGGKFKKADFIRLTGPALDARTGMTLAGKTVTAEGTFPPITPKRLPVVKGNSLKLNLPPGSATLITLVSATRPIAQAE
jgi:Glycosyl hydrolase family 79 C-terminal beta domain